MAARTREDELKELPQWRANKAAWEPGVRTVGLEELDCPPLRRGFLVHARSDSQDVGADAP
jgi:hypothetical protein